MNIRYIVLVLNLSIPQFLYTAEEIHLPEHRILIYAVADSVNVVTLPARQHSFASRHSPVILATAATFALTGLLFNLKPLHTPSCPLVTTPPTGESPFLDITAFPCNNSSSRHLSLYNVCLDSTEKIESQISEVCPENSKLVIRERRQQNNDPCVPLSTQLKPTKSSLHPAEKRSGFSAQRFSTAAQRRKK